MPRQRNTRPTKIYWLFDMRPETIAAGWSNGQPFYCGKTVHKMCDRLAGHRFDAKASPNRRVSKHLALVGAFLRAQIMEIVPADGDWIERERYWIRTLQVLYPNVMNVAAGGGGSPGYVHPPEVRAKMSADRMGHPTSPETRARISASNTGKTRSDEFRERQRLTAKNMSLETRAKISATLTGRKLSPERCAAISIANTGRVKGPEERAKLSAASKRNSAAISALHKGKIVSPETRLRMSVAAHRREQTKREQSRA